MTAYLRNGSLTNLAGAVQPVATVASGTDLALSMALGAVAVPTSAPRVGQKAVAVTGTAVAFSATSVPLPTCSVLVYALAGNAAAVTVGGSGVTNTVSGAGNGFILEAGQSVVIMADDLADVYVNGTADDIVTFSAG